MMLPLEFKLLGETISFQVLHAPADCEPQYAGRCLYGAPMRIEVYDLPASDVLQSFFHELTHCFMKITGLRNKNLSGDELICDISGTAIANFFRSNDPLIIRAILKECGVKTE